MAVIDRLDEIFLFIVGLLLLALGSWVSYMALSTPSLVDHCYTETAKTVRGPDLVRLKGNMEWGTDPSYGEYDTLDNAVLAAKKLDCPLTRGVAK